MKAIFLDRDGTIIVDKGYLHKQEDLEFEINAVEALKSLQKDFALIIVSNQSGVGRNLFSEEAFSKFNKEFLKKSSYKGIIFKKVFYCLHKPEDNCNCRKPKTGIVSEFLKKNYVDLENSFMIGDKPPDIKFGENLGVKSILLRTGEKDKSSNYSINPVFVANDLLEAAIFIKENTIL
jgi:histidinol-phosphate phosphatase family protein